MGNGFNDADRLGNNGWKGGALAILGTAPGTTNKQKAALELLRVRNDVGVPRDIVAAKPGGDFKIPKAKARRKQTVLDEDVYTSAIEAIIRRDFFPELSVYEAQAAYLTALENDDDEELRVLAARFATPVARASSSSAPATPAGWETPSVAGSIAGTPRHDPTLTPSPFDTPRRDGAAAAGAAAPVGGDEAESGPLKEADTSMSLDRFLATHTSEDNESFEILMEAHREKLIQKHEWLYRKAHAQRKQLALTTENEDRKIKEAEHGMQMPIEGWHYTPKNALMYYPEERALAIPSKIDKARSKPMSVSHANTRFAAGSPSKSGRHGLGTVSSAVSSEAASADGGSDSPKVNGYGFVVTPSPRPGVDLDPTMTWGVIDGTPFRLDAADSAAVASGPIFALPSQSAREKAEIQMQDEAARRKRKRAEHDQAVRTPQQRPRSGATPTSTAARLATMSPAAQRLGAQMFKGRSGVLSASYSRTPGTTPRSTPLRGATTTPLGTPRAGGSTPRSSRDLHGAGAGSVAAAIAASSGSITDGLL